MKRIIYTLFAHFKPNFRQIFFQDFEMFLRIEHGLGEITTEGYLKQIKHFLRQYKMPIPGRKQMIEYLNNFNNKSYAYRRNTKLALSWYAKYWGIKLQLEKERKPKRINKEFLTVDEIKKIFLACKNIREKALIVVLAYGGLRNREICSLKYDDVDLAEKCIFVRNGKMSKDRTVYMPDLACEVLEKYMRTIQGHKYFFKNLTNDNPMKPGQLRKFVRNIAKRAGINKRVYPHIFRYSLATNMVLNRSDILTVKEQLGHEHLQTTYQYIQSNPFLSQFNFQKVCPEYI